MMHVKTSAKFYRLSIESNLRKLELFGWTTVAIYKVCLTLQFAVNTVNIRLHRFTSVYIANIINVIILFIRLSEEPAGTRPRHSAGQASGARSDLVVVHKRRLGCEFWFGTPQIGRPVVCPSNRQAILEKKGNALHRGCIVIVRGGSSVSGCRPNRTRAFRSSNRLAKVFACGHCKSLFWMANSGLNSEPCPPPGRPLWSL